MDLFKSQESSSVIDELYVKLIVEAHDELAVGNYQKVIFLTQSLEAQGICNSEILKLMGVSLYKIQQFEQSWDTLSRAKALNPQDQNLVNIISDMEESASALRLDGKTQPLTLGTISDFLKDYPSRGNSNKVFEIKKQGVQNDICLNRIFNLTIVGYQGFLVDLENSILFKDSLTSKNNHAVGVRDLAWITPLDSDKIIHIPEPVAPLCGLWSGNFFHWINELLPRAMLLHENGFDGFYITPNANHPFIRESLNLIGISDRQIIPYPTRNGKFCGVKSDECWTVSPFCCDDFNQDPRLLLKLRKTLLSSLGIQEPQAKTRLFIKRTGLRKVKNEDALQELISKYKMKIFQAEKNSFSEQVEQAASSELIVGPHGSGLTLSLFMPENSVMIEMLPAGFLNPCFGHIRRALNHKHYAIPTMPNREYLDIERVEPDLHLLEAALEGEFKIPAIDVTSS